MSLVGHPTCHLCNAVLLRDCLNRAKIYIVVVGMNFLTHTKIKQQVEYITREMFSCAHVKTFTDMLKGVTD